MLETERNQISTQAVQKFVALTGKGSQLDGLYLDALQSKLALVIQVIDKAASSLSHPLFVMNVVPGYDVMVYTSNKHVANISIEVPSSAAISIDPRHLDALGLVLDEMFKGKSSSVLIHESSDAMQYVISPATAREATLANLGIAATEMTVADCSSAPSVH